MTSDKSVVDCSIVVFDKRPLTPTGSLALTEFVYQNNTYFDPAKNTVTIDVSGAGTLIPNVRPGDWIYDATITTPATGAAHAFFYRVVATDDLVLGGKRCVRYEVQTPLRGVFPTAFNATFGGYPGTSIYMEGVAEVFERGPVRGP